MEGQPLFQCQQCRQRLAVLPVEEDSLKLSGHSSRLDESFLLLEDAASGRAAQQSALEGGQPGPSGQRLEESFVVLPQQRQGGGGAPTALEAAAAAVQRVPFDARLHALAAVFEAASEEARVELPLCTDCAGEVHRQLEARLGEAQAEAAAYEAALARLEEKDPGPPLEERQYQRELQRVQEELATERERLARLERELRGAERELAAAEARSAELGVLEGRYWHSFNEFQLALREQMEERDALNYRIDATCSALAMLRRTSVLSDVFRIWFDGPFGTISGLRLGRTASQHVEWDEINAAWGQAVLLLATMAKACGVQFSQWRLLPMGSYPRVADARGTYDLFGPVSKFLCTSYDKAQAGYLGCLAEFGAWLRARGATDGGGNPFQLPWAIEGDKVGGLTIKLLLNKDKNWTRALKYMLVDLKFCLKYAISLLDRLGGPVAALAREDPAAAGSGPRR